MDSAFNPEKTLAGWRGRTNGLSIDMYLISVLSCPPVMDQGLLGLMRVRGKQMPSLSFWEWSVHIHGIVIPMEDACHPF